MKTVVQHIASSLQAMENCKKFNNLEWLENHQQSIIDTVSNYLPSGSGIDAGVEFNFDKSTPEKLVFNFSYHHMNENGYYDGWTNHNLIVTPSLYTPFMLRITGKNRNNIKEYLYDVMSEALSAEYK